MARNVATKWIIGILIYFVVLFTYLSMINNTIIEYSLYDSNVISSTGGSYGFATLGTCETPREDELSKYDIKCSSLVDIGKIVDNTSCLSYEGCSWVESGKFLGIFGTATFGCEGRFNTTYYNDGVNFTTINPFGYATDNICTMTNLSNSGTCSAFGCTWYPDNTFEEMNYKDATTGIFGIIGDIVTLRVNFATSNTAVNGVLTFFLIWIPLIILILSGYIMLR